MLHAACIDLALRSVAVCYNDYAVMCKCECVLVMDMLGWPPQTATSSA